MGKYKAAIERQGRFGKLFVEYKGCPRGPTGRMASGQEVSKEERLIKEVLSQPVITDVDGGRWIPVNADALHELTNAFKKLEPTMPNNAVVEHNWTDIRGYHGPSGDPRDAGKYKFRLES